MGGLVLDRDTKVLIHKIYKTLKDKFKSNKERYFYFSRKSRNNVKIVIRHLDRSISITTGLMVMYIPSDLHIVTKGDFVSIGYRVTDFAVRGRGYYNNYYELHDYLAFLIFLVDITSDTRVHRFYDIVNKNNIPRVLQEYNIQTEEDFNHVIGSFGLDKLQNMTSKDLFKVSAELFNSIKAENTPYYRDIAKVSEDCANQFYEDIENIVECRSKITSFRKVLEDIVPLVTLNIGKSAESDKKPFICYSRYGNATPINLSNFNLSSILFDLKTYCEVCGDVFMFHEANLHSGKYTIDIKP